MHFLYIDEAGSTGADLTAVQQPVFVMAGLIVSDERWRKTSQAVRDKLACYFAAGPPLAADFELHACQLLSPNGDGPFVGHDRARRNALALDLLKLIEDRGHYLLHVPIHKAKLQATAVPDMDCGFDWQHPWQFAFALQVTMFEEFLRSSATGSTSTGLAIIDHEDACVEFVRAHTASRQAETGWKQLKKTVEIGYSASSHANPLLQLTDLAAYTLKKFYLLETVAAAQWPQSAKDFFQTCKAAMWPRIRFKTYSFTKLKVHAAFLNYAKVIRKL